MIPPQPHIAAMDAYALADMAAPPGKRLISLCQNESLRAPSPDALRAAAQAAQNQHLYPDPDWTDLRQSIADLNDINRDQIVCGNGSLDLIACLARAYLGPGVEALAPVHAYPFFKTATCATGAAYKTAPEQDMTTDVDALIAASGPRTRIVFVANPGNPTGTRVPVAELRRLRARLAEDVLLVIDEAYGEFADHLGEASYDAADLGNTVVLRTFSKAYGLAGARVGWGYFPVDVAGHVRKLLNPNNVSAPSQAAASAALLDQVYMRETCKLTADICEDFCARLRKSGLSAAPSFTNFALIAFDTETAARDADQMLRAEGVFLRPQRGVGLLNCLRATIGVADDMAFTAQLLEDWIKEGGLG